MCQLPNPTPANVGLTGRFIAETNAFLTLHWDDAAFGWPLKPVSCALRVTCNETAPGAGGATVGVEAQKSEAALLNTPDLLARIQQIDPPYDRLRGPDAPQVFLVFLTAPGGQWPAGGIELLRNVRILGVAPGGADVAAAAATPGSRLGHNQTPRRRRHIMDARP